MPSNEALIQQAIDYWADLFLSVTDFNWYDAAEDQAFVNARRALEEVIGTNQSTAPLANRPEWFAQIIAGALAKAMGQDWPMPTATVAKLDPQQGS